MPVQRAKRVEPRAQRRVARRVGREFVVSPPPWRRVRTPSASAISCAQYALRAPPPIRESASVCVPPAISASKPSASASVTPSSTA
ncbi:xylulokinase domain protein [Burkholderia pseudomallei]|nr:xylulokinase domain protein [Burkholderia pseudomallei]